MKTGTALLAALFAATSLPVLAQQSPLDNQSSPSMQNTAPGSQPEQPVPSRSSSPTGESAPATPAQQRTNPAAQPTQSNPDSTPPTEANQAANPEGATVKGAELHPVQAELVSSLDSKTAKTGDNVVVQTKSTVKTADGTEIPKGSKLVGHVVAVQASNGGTNSQVALKFDHAELKGGQKLPIVSEIQSIEAKGGGESSAMPSTAGPSTAPNSGSASANSGATPGSSSMPSQNSAGASRSPGYAPEGSGMGNAAPSAGTVVAKTGNITIQTTAVPGVLLANNSPGQQDPRMAQVSSILLGAKKDVKLDGGTELTVAVATVAGEPNQ